ncbi:hypothetical protein ACKKBG_A12130 [Auxenochlorella protothecoides x Auxenochlorella symbiontica]
MDCELEASGTPVDAAGASTASKEDALAALPSFGRPGRRKPDPRRQSVALFNAFSQTTSGRGFLSGDEIALGDEDVQIPLDKSGRLLGGVSNHSQLWVEPGMDDLLSSELPSPELGVLSQASGGAANGGPLPSPMRGLHGAETLHASELDVMSSVSVLGGFSRMCLSTAETLESLPEDDFLSKDVDADKLGCLFHMSPSRKRGEAGAAMAGTRARAPSSHTQSGEGSPSEALPPLQKLGATPVRREEHDWSLKACRPDPHEPGLRTPSQPSQQSLTQPTCTPSGALPPPPACSSSTPSRLPKTPSRLPRPPPLARDASRGATRLPQAPGHGRVPGGAAPAASRARSGAPAPAAQPARKAAPASAAPARTARLPSRTVKKAQPAPEPAAPGVPTLASGDCAASEATESAEAELTPRTAQIRYLEQHPELVFGWTAPSRMMQSPDPATRQAQARKLTAEERHLRDWQDG